MGKRSDTGVARDKDYWPTIDPSAIPPALISQVRGSTYAEPCYGNGDLEDLLMEVAHCKWRSDIRETVGSSKVMDALDITKKDLDGIDYIITNPPYQWDMLKPLLGHFLELKPTWLLLPADFMHNKRSAPYIYFCRYILAVRRLYWVENKVKGKDNYCWFLFNKCKTTSYPEFVPRG